MYYWKQEYYKPGILIKLIRSLGLGEHPLSKSFLGVDLKKWQLSCGKFIGESSAGYLCQNPETWKLYLVYGKEKDRDE